MPCPVKQEDRPAAVRLPTASVASIPGRIYARRDGTHSAAYLADHAEHAAWMMTPQPDLTEAVALELAAD
jgi:hypothetical protein